MLQTTDERQLDYWANGDPHLRPYSHPVVQIFARQRLNHLANHLDLLAVGRALDVGCGDGFSTFYAAERLREVWAVDRSHAMLRRHPFQGGGRLAVSDARNLPFSSHSFDLVYGWEILHHVSKPEVAVAEMARVSRRYVLVVEPNRNHPAQFLFALLDQEHRWVLKYSLGYLTSLVRKAGLSVKYAGTGGHTFPNRTPQVLVPLLARLPYASKLGISNWVLGEIP